MTKTIGYISYETMALICLRIACGYSETLPFLNAGIDVEFIFGLSRFRVF